MVTSPWAGMAMGLHSHTPDDECDDTCTFYPAPTRGSTMYELRVSNAYYDDQGTAVHEDRVLGTYASYEAARDAAVPDHPEEWVWLDDRGVWYHGGGTEPGQSFTITPGPANITPREPASSADR